MRMFAANGQTRKSTASLQPLNTPKRNGWARKTYDMGHPRSTQLVLEYNDDRHSIETERIAYEQVTKHGTVKTIAYKVYLHRRLREDVIISHL